MDAQSAPTLAFPGFPDFQANVTFVPIQFFTLVLPRSSRGCARLVGYMIRHILGWVDTHGNPTREKLQFSYRDLIRDAGVSRETISAALREAQSKGFIRCVRRPRAARPGQRGQCGIYELNWDEQGPYTDSPASFRGFYFPEAAVMVEEEQGAPVQRVKAARKNIPNAFFDYLLPRERLSVIRVVGALLFYSIQWGKGGERKVPVRLSITALSRLAHLSRRHVHAAVTEAVERGYLTCLEPGQFDPKAGAESRPATYGVRWTRSPAALLDSRPATAIKRERSEKVNGKAVGKGEREQSEKVHGERSEKVNGISIKTDLKTSTTAAAEYHRDPPPSESAAAAVSPGLELLVQVGFDERGARYLAERSSLETIRQQLDWLPLRKATNSRLGLLRRAIEQNWPKPEKLAEDASKGSEAATAFARYYYAGYHGNEGEPAAEPFRKDVQAAETLINRLREIDPDPTLVPKWGREFGRFVRRKQAGEARAKPYLGAAVLLHGDDFVRGVRGQSERAQKIQQQRAHEARHETFAAQYDQYLRETEKSYQDRLPALYAEFEKHHRQSRTMIQTGLGPSPRILEWFDAEATRLHAFAKFFRRHPEHPVLSFDRWEPRQHRPPPPVAPTRLEEAAP